MVYTRIYLCLGNEMVTFGGEFQNEAEVNVEVKMRKCWTGNGHTMIPSSEFGVRKERKLKWLLIFGTSVFFTYFTENFSTRGLLNCNLKKSRHVLKASYQRESLQ